MFNQSVLCAEMETNSVLANSNLKYDVYYRNWN